MSNGAEPLEEDIILLESEWFHIQHIPLIITVLLLSTLVCYRCFLWTFSITELSTENHIHKMTAHRHNEHKLQIGSQLWHLNCSFTWQHKQKYFDVKYYDYRWLKTEASGRLLLTWFCSMKLVD